MMPGQLVGVVGPNGCGKSNIIDAVRWVLGESRASELRGESMQDVIFNGTNTRKPASRASVELVFDNASHRAGGQWSQFAEIAVKRVLTRDGTSSYYINNQPVRRRDVQDVFLGTGLGPRAYAIIGQGTISRIIESKPEELRLFLEEAAGVSKYKERRRETENRLSDTRENLVRVEDILRELNANLEKLERQAQIALRFRDLQNQAALRQHQLWFLKRAEAQSEQVQLHQQVEQAVTTLESKTADLRQVEARVETIRQAHYLAGEQVNEAQGHLYQASAEVGRLEAEIRFVLEGRQRAQQRLAQLQAQIEQWNLQTHQAQDEAKQLGVAQESAITQLAGLNNERERELEQLPALEQTWRDAQQQVVAQVTLVNEVRQQIHVLAAEQRGLQEQASQLEQRKTRLQSDQQALAHLEDAQLEQLQSQLSLAQATSATTQDQLNALEEMAESLETARREAQDASNRESAKWVELQARQEALKALQDKLRTDERLMPWLKKHGLQALQPLWSKVHITPGWEKALEAALHERLAALEVTRIDSVKAFASDVPDAKLSFYASGGAVAQANHSGLPRLFDQLQLNDPGLSGIFADWLTGCYTANTLDEALAARLNLNPGEQVFIPQGHSVGLHSMSFYAQDNEQAGMLARAQEIDSLDQQIQAQGLLSEKARICLSRAEITATQSAQERTQKRIEATKAQADAHTLQVEFMRMQQQSEQTRARQGQLETEAKDLQAQFGLLRVRIEAAETRFEALDSQLANMQGRHAELEENAMSTEQALNRARERLRQLELHAQESDFNLRTLSAKLAELQRTQDTASQQIDSLAAEQTRQQTELELLSDSAAKSGLQDALALKVERENLLASKRSAYDDLTNSLRTSNEDRLRIERELDPLRQRIVELQLKEQASRLGSERFESLLSDAHADMVEIEASIEAGKVRLTGLQTEIDGLQRDIQSLGAVNLAALEELGTARERKVFLDAQSADLNDAIKTLEDAIKKIDGETRQLLAGTFETVNQHFGRMFPVLFGGGNARLVMTGEEILDSGVQVMAQPPGKKNQTIYLLSGGEKALTAIALVFAIFQLNPAPFCLLDEVDAPLDDANTERYTKLVTKMSSETQFLFISHNKITMEMAEQLIGVTMQEQGVSRIVAVDMEAAVNMVDAA